MIGTAIESVTPDTNEYTAVLLLVALSTIGRQTSIADAPGSPQHYTKPTCFATNGIVMIAKSSLITLCINDIAPAIT